MKVMKVVDKKIGNTTYYKYRINLPKEAVEQLNLIDKELKVKIYMKNFKGAIQGESLERSNGGEGFVRTIDISVKVGVFEPRFEEI